MDRASYLQPRLNPSTRTSRGGALLITVAVHVLILLLLLTLAPPDVLRQAEPDALKTFNIAPTGAKAAPKPRGETRRSKAAPPPPSTPHVPPPPVALNMTPLIPGLENFDLRNVHSDVARNDAGAAQGQDSKAAYGPGEGPGGARLYNAEWYREPTDAELSTYLPARRQPGWGIIACQTVERFHVDNCRALGDDPPGSGLAQAIRKAAWQFLVRPPRIDGKPIIGAWVRIKIEVTEAGAVQPH